MVVTLVVEVLRGVAQVDFLPSAVCGLFFAAALFAAGWQYGRYGLLGSAVSTAVGYGLGLRRETVEAGLTGYSGCLVATAVTVAAPGFRRLWPQGVGPAAPPVPATGGSGLSGERLWRGFFADIGQISFMPQWYVGLLFLAGLFAASRVLAAVPAIPRLRRV
ncbi:urea transporter [Streptomyces sp. CBMA123]|uniref:urea transporter n=1 Tax=Streptomyces sp. CBMA123 TaxID=1896313 RepID=UPI001CB7F027|nr:urea transporter [Streptomyces sp. CBMA123]